MERDDRDPRLSEISTQWTMVFQAHGSQPDLVGAAQAELMCRYSGAVHRYLLGVLHDPDAAADLDQEFAVRFLRGDFHRADPSRGRFRDFVKRALRNLMIDHQRRRKVRPRSAGDALPEVASDGSGESGSIDDFDRRFLESWRKELMGRAWAALEELQGRTGQPYHTVLRLRVEHPEMRSPQLAEALSARLGRPITAGGLRQALQRARDQFVGFLLDEVSASLDHPTRDQLQEELIDLGLLEYCRPALKRRGHAL